MQYGRVYHEYIVLIILLENLYVSHLKCGGAEVQIPKKLKQA